MAREIRLKGEEADWVDEQLQKDVQSGQLIRGNSDWASPPFATKEFAAHHTAAISAAIQLADVLTLRNAASSLQFSVSYM